jgi:hypothetical protein
VASQPSTQSACRPSDICLTLAAVTDDWLSADQIAGRLKRLGFEGYKAQAVSAWLRRLSRMDAPPIESREAGWTSDSYLEFRTTNWGRTWLANNVRWAREWR